MADRSPFTQAQRLRIYINEGDHWRARPLDAALLDVLKTLDIAGATVLRASAGFGARGQIHSAHIEALSTDLPLVIEVVDLPEKISRAIEAVKTMVREGLITVEDVQIVKSSQPARSAFPGKRLVAEIMTRQVHTLAPDQPVYQAWQAMLEKAVKALPVVDPSGRVLGILTNGDLFERAGIRQRLSVAIRMDAAELNQELQALRQSSLTVADVMSKPAVTISESTDLASAVAGMVKTGLKRLPVVDERGILVGIISRLDILRLAASAPAEKPASPAAATEVRTIRDVMRPLQAVVAENDGLSAILDKFSESGSRRLVVVDARGHAVGIISDSDVVARIQPARRGGILNALRRLTPAPGGGETARDLMSPGPLSASANLNVLDAVKMMLAQSRKWLIVLDDRGAPVGLVDREILLETLSAIYNKG